MPSSPAAGTISCDPSTPVVVLTAYNHLSLGIVRSLGRLGVPVYCVHPDRDPPAMRSRYLAGSFLHDVVGSTGEENLRYLLDAGRRIGRRSVLIHTSDDTAVFVDGQGDRLREWFILPDQPRGLAGNLASKKEMHRLAKRHGIPTPETLFPQSRAELLDSLGKVSYPVMLKGIDGLLLAARTGKKMVIVRSREELLEWYDRLEDPGAPNLMLQEYIPGGAESVWMLNGYFNRDSDCLMAITGRKIRQAPVYTGYTSLGVCVPNDAVVSLTKAFMKAVGYRGILDIGYRFDERDGLYKVLDVNPRVGATFRLFVGENGMDVVRAAYLDLTGQPVPATDPRPGRRWFVEDRDLSSSYRYYRDGRLTVGEWVRSFRGVEEAAFFAADDAAPFVRMVTNHVRKSLKSIVRRARPAAAGA